VSLTALLIAALLATAADPAPGNDDRVQLESDFLSACLLGVDLELGAGRYDVTRKPSLAGVAIASLRFRCDREVRIVCEPGATFAFMGGALVGAETTPRAWTLMEVGGRVRMTGCSFDGDGKVGPTGEQTHLMQVIGPYDGVPQVAGNTPDFDGNTFTMRPGAYRSGDNIRIIGEPTQGRPVRNVWFRNTTMPNGSRSCWGMQRGVIGFLSQGSTCDEVQDACLDYEQTGDGHGVDHVWEDGTCSRGPEAQGSVSVSIGGYDTARAVNVTLRRWTILDGGIYAVNAHGTLLEDVTVIQPHNDAAVAFSQGSVGNTILRSRLVRGGTGPVVHSYRQAGLSPSNLSIVDSTLIHAGTGVGVVYESSTGLDWRGGTLSVASGRVCGLAVSSAGSDVADISVSDVVTSCPPGSRFYQGDPYARTIAPPTFTKMVGMP
jgi:hypothetical protein